MSGIVMIFVDPETANLLPGELQGRRYRLQLAADGMSWQAVE
jgi:hypothetical protein